MEDGFFLRKKPLSSMDSVNTRIENAVALSITHNSGSSGGVYGIDNSDPPSGNETIWKGLTRLVNIQLGVIMGAGVAGN
jgi:hypothetical protein